jgi:hypothetical protein
LSDCHAASKACFIRTATSGPKDFDERDWLAFRVEPIRPVDDKVGRVYQAKFEVGLVHFPKQAEFLPTLEAELLAFRTARPTIRSTASFRISHTNTLLITRTGSMGSRGS